LIEIGVGDWLEARVRPDLGGFFPGSHGKFPKKTPLFHDFRHRMGMKIRFSLKIRFESRAIPVREIKPRPRD
jgi:hypothetical protein